MSQPRSARRCWFQFSLRSLLIVVTLVAFTMPTVANHYAEWRETRRQFEEERLATLRPADFEVFKPTARTGMRSRVPLGYAYSQPALRQPIATP